MISMFRQVSSSTLSPQRCMQGFTEIRPGRRAAYRSPWPAIVRAAPAGFFVTKDRGADRKLRPRVGAGGEGGIADAAGINAS